MLGKDRPKEICFSNPSDAVMFLILFLVCTPWRVSWGTAQIEAVECQTLDFKAI